MRSLVLEDTRRLVWQEAPAPQRRHEREAVVRPLAVATCDLDQPMIFGQTPFVLPIHLGHECVAEVVEGPECFEVGQRVVEGEPERSLGAFPVTVDATATPEGLVATLRLTEWGGRCTSIGQLAPEAPLPLFELYTRGVHLHIGRAMARPVMPTILDLVAAGRLRPQLVTSATVAWDDAPQALLPPATQLVFSRA